MTIFTKFMYSVLALILLYVFVVVAAYLFQRQLIYHPTKYYTMGPTFSANNAMFVELITADQLALRAIYQPASEGKPTIIHFFGNAGYLGDLPPTLDALAQQGYGVLQVGYRGYSRNPGRPSEAGLTLDARAALAFVYQQNIPEDEIILFGESLGAAVATKLATEFKPKAIILQTPFSSLVEIAELHYPYLPVKDLLKDRFETINHITNSESSVLVVHGDSDTTVPLASGKAVFEAAHEPKQMHIINGANHNDLPDYSKLVIQFLALPPTATESVVNAEPIANTDTDGETDASTASDTESTETDTEPTETAE